ncbi:hypothetical protein [Leptospira idonii]|uniref:Uncharacterized protein n=1 Tax=Leptospira idonii TaxID=1193500 RepID=A0A4R9LXE4_9LEPT|nr:hypothetical protein [Leptospira idonii]TGN17985.1 hypothetical protein EHS15_15740 [Leptospira idonii]
MEIKLNESEAKHLLEALAIYEWVVNSPHEESEESVDSFCQSLFQKLHKAGLGKPIEVDSSGTYSLSEEFFHNLHESYIDPYNDDIFWSDLAFELGQRDLSKTVSESDLKKMSEEELERKSEVEIQKYDKEFETHGIDRLFIKK